MQEGYVNVYKPQARAASEADEPARLIEPALIIAAAEAGGGFEAVV